jgi:hypothetical protein
MSNPEMYIEETNANVYIVHDNPGFKSLNTKSISPELWERYRLAETEWDDVQNEIHGIVLKRRLAMQERAVAREARALGYKLVKDN